MEVNKKSSRTKRLRNIIALFLCACMVFLVVGCSNSGKNISTDDTENGTKGQTAAGGKDTKDERGTTAEGSGIPEYLNTGGTLPIVKEGYEEGFTIAMSLDVNAGKPEDMWAYHFITKAMNINVEIDAFTNQNRAEYISLLFASNDLPDVIIGGGLSADELMMYGEREGQIIDLAPYINETYMPYLTKLYKENPDWKNAVMDSEGHVFSLGYINDPSDQGQIPRMFYNYDWLDELNMEVPTTLDDFVDMLRAFKAMKDDIIPIGGSYNATNSTLGILNAFGYNTANPKGTSIALRDGKAVLPVADRNAYGAYLTLMNTLYKEGLIAQDFYTADATTIKAYMSEGRNGVIAQAPFVYTEDFNQWWGAIPLTSDYNDTAFWPSSTGAVTAGQFVVSAECKCPELAAVFGDWFFDPNSKNYTMFANGAYSGDTDILYGTSGWTVTDDETRSVVYIDYENNKDIYNSKNEYLVQKIQLIGYRVLGYGYWSTVGTWSYQLLAGYTWDDCIDGYPDIDAYTGDIPLRHTIAYNETHFRTALKDTLVDYVVEGYPSNVYFDAETSTNASNLAIILNEYAEQESAKFITGARSLSELDAYFDEMERLGVEEYVQYYADYYEALNAK